MAGHGIQQAMQANRIWPKDKWLMLSAAVLQQIIYERKLIVDAFHDGSYMRSLGFRLCLCQQIRVSNDA
jgi:hypothetical protein